MGYRYETHCHCSQCSACARSVSGDMVRAYHKVGFAGLVLTDHFIFGNTAVDRSLPWEARMRCYYQAYLDAKAVAEPLDFDVIFGIEHAYGHGKEVLIYGVDLDFLLENPDIPDISLDVLVSRVHAWGGLVIQAHPYRDRSYVDMSVEPRADLVDGFEVHNMYNLPGEDPRALRLARQGDYILTSGGDVHTADDINIGRAGLEFSHRIRDGKELVAALKQGGYRHIVGGRLLQKLQETDLP